MADATSPDNLPHDNYGAQFNVAIWILTGAAALFIALRMYCKFVRNKKMWWDDYILIASFVSVIRECLILPLWRDELANSFACLDYAYSTDVSSVCRRALRLRQA